MSNSPIIIGKSPILSQGKIIVQLIGESLPKIGSSVLIKQNKKFNRIGEILEVIGSTKKPWLVIAVAKNKIALLSEEETLFSAPKSDRPKQKKKPRYKQSKKPRHKRD